MSRMSAPVEDGAPGASHPVLDTAARRFGFVRTTLHALAAGPNALDAWLDARKAMRASPGVVPRQIGTHAVEEVRA